LSFASPLAILLPPSTLQQIDFGRWPLSPEGIQRTKYGLQGRK